MRGRATGWMVLMVIYVCLTVTVATGRAVAQSASVGSTVVQRPAGWNLISYGASTSLTSTTGLGFYYLSHGASAYAQTDSSHLAPGVGYWVYYPTATQSRLVSWLTRTHVSVFPHTCSTIGNPSLTASIRVSGADAVFVYSPSLGNYIAETVLGIGRGAFACNYSDNTEDVLIADVGDLTAFSTADLVDRTPIAATGMARFLFRNDSPYPSTIALATVTADNTFPTTISSYGDTAPACRTCVEYAAGAHMGCNAAASSIGFLVRPGRYVVHIQVEGHDIADLQGYVQLDADTQYAACVFVNADDPIRSLP